MLGLGKVALQCASTIGHLTMKNKWFRLYTDLRFECSGLHGCLQPPKYMLGGTTHQHISIQEVPGLF